MSISKHQILSSLAAIELHAPVYFGGMPVADDLVRDIFAAAMAGLSASPAFECATPACRETALLAVLAHVMLESTHLQYQLRASGAAASCEAVRLLARSAAH